MAVSRQTKAKSLEELTGLFAQAQSLVLADYEGLTVVQVDQLRRKCREAGVQYKVVKNRIAKLAIQGTNKEPASKLFKGTIAVAFSNEDAAAPAKVLLEYKKGLDKAIQDKFKVRGAVFEGQVVDAAGCRAKTKLAQCCSASSTHPPRRWFASSPPVRRTSSMSCRRARPNSKSRPRNGTARIRESASGSPPSHRLNIRRARRHQTRRNPRQA